MLYFSKVVKANIRFIDLQKYTPNIYHGVMVSKLD